MPIGHDLGGLSPHHLWTVCGCFLVRTAEQSCGHRAELFIICPPAENVCRVLIRVLTGAFSGPTQRWRQPAVSIFSVELEDIPESTRVLSQGFQEFYSLHTHTPHTHP